MEIKNIDLMIVGAQKAGTTSLKNYLSEHPQIVSHIPIELPYFANDSDFEEGYAASFEKYFEVNKLETSQKIVAKSIAICVNETAIKRLKEHNPDCILVFVLREPVSRAYSSYSMAVNYGWMKQEFSKLKEVIEAQDYDHVMYRNFIKLGVYYDQLKVIYQYFPKEQVKLVLFEELKGNPAKVCKQLFESLGVDSTFTPQVEKVPDHETKKVKSLYLASLTKKLRNKNNVLKK